MFQQVFPLEIQRHILSYDATFPEYFSKEVLPELMNEVWKKFTYRFFVATIDFTIYVEEFYDMLSDFEEEDENESENEDW